MAVIKSGATSDQWTIDPTSKAGRVTPYDSGGTYRGQKSTYRAATNATLAAASGTASFFAIFGSSTKTIVVQRIRLSGLTTTTTTVYSGVVARKYSTAISGGTSTDMTSVPLDSNFAASTQSILKVYTAAPTDGTLVGVIAAERIFTPNATTTQGDGIIDIDFRHMGGETTGVVLRGTGEGLTLAFATAPGNTTTLAIDVEWTEE